MNDDVIVLSDTCGDNCSAFISDVSEALTLWHDQVSVVAADVTSNRPRRAGDLKGRRQPLAQARVVQH